MIRRCLHTADSKTKLLAFNTVVRPILEYATQVWSPREVGLTKSIDTIHGKAIRWVYLMTKRDSVTEQMKSKNIQSLVDRRDDQDLMFLRKIEFDDFNIHLEDYIHA